MQFIDEYEEKDPYYLDPVGIELKTFPQDYIKRHQTFSQPSHLMPSNSFYMGQHSIQLKASFETIHYAVSETIGSIECLKAHYDDCCWKWVMQYGTRTLFSMLTYKQRQYYELKGEIVREMIDTVRLTRYMEVSPFYFSKKGISNSNINEKRYWINDAVTEALNRFPHLFDLDAFDLNPIPIGGGLCRWSEIECQYYDNGDTIILSFHYNSIDRNSFYYVFHRLWNALLNRQNLLSIERKLRWIARAQYICLLEGTLETETLETETLETETLETETLETWDHISRYLMNIYVCKEICTYLN